MQVGSNTKEKGIFRFFVYKEGDGDFVGVCLDLNLIEYGKDSKEVMMSVEEAAFSILKSVRNKNLSDSLLNNIAPQKYWKIASKFKNWDEPKSIKVPLKKRSLDQYFINFVQKPYTPSNYSLA